MRSLSVVCFYLSFNFYLPFNPDSLSQAIDPSQDKKKAPPDPLGRGGARVSDSMATKNPT